MFFTYLRRELRRRMRQAVFISLGLALGVGLVITVTAASDGVQNSQTSVLHSLYGVGTDVTVTQPPKSGAPGNGIAFSVRQQIKSMRKGDTSLAGTSIDINDLVNSQYGTLTSAQLAQVAHQPHVTAAVGGLILVDATVSGTVPSTSLRQSGSISSSFHTNSFTVAGVDPAHTGVGPLSAAQLVAGHELTAADSHADDVVIDSGYARQDKLSVGQKINVGGTSFKVVGIVRVPQGGSPPDAYIPLARAQSLGKTGSTALTGKVNTIYVTAASAADISAVQAAISGLLPRATVTDQNDLASEVTGSLSNASSLANNLGRWLSVAVLVAAFLLASLLTMAAVARRVREFGTLKALGWRSRRVILQVLGESLVIGIVGGVIGIGLGFGGAALIDKLAPKLSATVGSASSADVVGGSRFGGAGALKALTDTAHTVSVTLTAPVTLGVVLVAVALAVAGGLVAGCFGGWRAARLRPAAALTRVE